LEVVVVAAKMTMMIQIGCKSQEKARRTDNRQNQMKKTATRQRLSSWNNERGRKKGGKTI